MMNGYNITVFVLPIRLNVFCRWYIFKGSRHLRCCGIADHTTVLLCFKLNLYQLPETIGSIFRAFCFGLTVVHCLGSYSNGFEIQISTVFLLSGTCSTDNFTNYLSGVYIVASIHQAYSLYSLRHGKKLGFQVPRFLYSGDCSQLETFQDFQRVSGKYVNFREL